VKCRGHATEVQKSTCEFNDGLSGYKHLSKNGKDGVERLLASNSFYIQGTLH